MRSAPPRASAQAADSRARASSRPTNRPAPVSGAGRGGWVDGASGARAPAGRPRRTCSTSSRVSADGTMPSSRRSRSRSASNAPIAPARSPARASRPIRSRARRARPAGPRRRGAGSTRSPRRRRRRPRPAPRARPAGPPPRRGAHRAAGRPTPRRARPGGRRRRAPAPPRAAPSATSGRNSARSTRTSAGSGESPRRSRSLTSQASAPGPRAPRSAHAAWRRLLRALSSRASGRRVPARALRGCSPGMDREPRQQGPHPRRRRQLDRGPVGAGLEAPEDPDLQHRGKPSAAGPGARPRSPHCACLRP